MNDKDWIHEALDRDPPPGDREPSPDLGTYRSTLEALEGCRPAAPPDLLGRVMQELPGEPERGGLWSLRLPRWDLRRPLWLAPAAGALAAVLLYVGIGVFAPPSGNEAVTVRFEVHAPSAERVELVGTFNDWKPGEILLRGPDASGHWAATVPVPAGRHEYVFLIDGSQWLADPRAAAYRPDGFGRVNALLEL